LVDAAGEATFILQSRGSSAHVPTVRSAHVLIDICHTLLSGGTYIIFAD